MKYIISCVATSLFLFGCSKEPTQPHISNYQEIEILSIKRPKHFKMSYRIVSTGQVVETRSKHCNAWRSISVGKRYMADVNERGCYVIRSIK